MTFPPIPTSFFSIVNMLVQNVFSCVVMMLVASVASAASKAVPSPPAASPAASSSVVFLKRNNNNNWLGKVPASVWDQMPLHKVEEMLTI